MRVVSGPNMAKLVGLFTHLAYHIVLGELNPVSIEPLIKKQIFVNIMEQTQRIKGEF